MNNGSAGLRTWTQRFTVASVGSFVSSLLALLGEANEAAVLIGVFGFICPMVFGMAYLLLPSYVGETLVDQRLAGIHFVLAYVGVILLVADQLGTEEIPLKLLGVTLWAIGTLVFVGSLLATVGPTAVGTVAETLRGSGRSQRSTRLATTMIPVAVGYLLIGTIALLTIVAPLQIGAITVAQVVHYYLIGFATLLIYALGTRLLTAFFHVSLPRPVVWAMLITGAIAPAFLGTFLWIDPWFQVGGVFATLSMLGYAGIVLLVVLKTDRRRVGVSGIALGAIAGGARRRVGGSGRVRSRAADVHRRPSNAHLGRVLSAYNRRICVSILPDYGRSVYGCERAIGPHDDWRAWGRCRHTVGRSCLSVRIGTRNRASRIHSRYDRMWLPSRTSIFERLRIICSNTTAERTRTMRPLSEHVRE